MKIVVLIIFATFLIFLMLPTDVPPNFKTTILMGLFFLNLNIDKIHLVYKVK